jgi:hypothetical protein
MKNTTADVPPQAAAEFAKARRPEAVAEADGAGYTKTKKMQKGAQQPSQFGLPKSPGKGPGLHLRISIHPDGDEGGAPPMPPPGGKGRMMKG